MINSIVNPSAICATQIILEFTSTDAGHKLSLITIYPGTVLSNFQEVQHPLISACPAQLHLNPARHCNTVTKFEHTHPPAAASSACRTDHTALSPYEITHTRYVNVKRYTHETPQALDARQTCLLGVVSALAARMYNFVSLDYVEDSLRKNIRRKITRCTHHNTEPACD